MKNVRPALPEALLLSLCAAILIWKLLLPGFIGMANNGDFGKVIGPLSMDGADHGADNFIFFEPDYVRGPQYYLGAPYFSSETALAWLASSVQRISSDPARFDIRWMGALHILIFLGFYFSILLLLRPLGAASRVILSLAALWIFADTGLIAYLNSFFTDTAAILGGLTAIILALHLAIADRPGLAPLTLFGLAALLFAVSKAQHGLLGVVAVAFAFWLAWRVPEPHTRLAACVVGLVILSAIVWTVAGTPAYYTSQARFNLIFFWLLPNSKTPAQDLLELGLSPGDARYSGMTSYSSGTPMNDAGFRDYFASRTSYSSVRKFYLRHPGRPLSKLLSDLWREAPNRRVAYLSNYRRQDGKPAGARDGRLASWSTLRTWLFRCWPAHILIWLAIAICVPPFLARGGKSRRRRLLAWAISIVALLAAAEFLTVSLADACETDRHLTMFHMFTDMTMFLGLVLAASSLERQPSLAHSSEMQAASTVSAVRA